MSAQQNSAPEWGGKGSLRRAYTPGMDQRYRENHDAIFGKKKSKNKVASTSTPREIGFHCDSMCSEAFLSRPNARQIADTIDGFGSCGEYLT